MNICFLLTHVPDPKTNKRIKVFKKNGKISVICTRRKSQDIWEPAFPDIEHYIYDIDLPTVNHLIRRYIVSSTYKKRALKKLEELEPEIIYADGLDSLLIAVKYKKHHKIVLFYDVADLRETYIEEPKQKIKKIINNMVKFVEKQSFKKVDYLVITSKKFYSTYYYKLINKNRVIYIPNVPDKEIFENYRKKQEGDFTIGFIGGIRYLNQMKMLVDVAGICGYKVLFAGAGGTIGDYDQIVAYCKDKEYVKFTGKYNYQEDIAKLYGQVDCVYAVYDADNANVKIALPNKLYESVYCRLPIIVAKGTYLAEIVEQWGVGISVSHEKKDELKVALNRLAIDEKLKKKIEKHCSFITSRVDFKIYAENLQKSIDQALKE